MRCPGTRWFWRARQDPEPEWYPAGLFGACINRIPNQNRSNICLACRSKQDKNNIRCQMYAKTEDHIELKLYFKSRYPHHRFSAQQKMQHLRISWRNPCIWRLDICQIIQSCSYFWMDHKLKQASSLIDWFQSMYDVRRGSYSLILPFTSKTGQSVAQNRQKIF